MLLVFRPDLWIACLINRSFTPIGQVHWTSNLLLGFIFGAITACAAFYHTFFVDFLKGQHHYEHVLCTTLEEALQVELPEALQEASTFEYYASTKKLARDGIEFLGGVDAAFELFCFHLLSGTLAEKFATKHRGAAFYFFLCAHSPEYDTDWYAYASLKDPNRNPAGLSSLISAGAEVSRAMTGVCWGRPEMIGEGLWAVGKRVLIVIATLKPRLIKIWQGRTMRVDFLRRIRQPLPKPQWLDRVEGWQWYQVVAAYATKVGKTLANDFSLAIDRLYASVAIYSILFVMPAFFRDAWHEATREVTDGGLMTLGETIGYNLTHSPIAIFTTGMALFLPFGYVELIFLDNQDPPVEVPDVTYSLDEPVTWVPLYVLKDIAGEGNAADRYQRLAAIIPDTASVELAAERLGIGAPLEQPVRLFKLVLGRFLSKTGRSQGDNPVRAYIDELESLLKQSKQQEEGTESESVAA
ncbi:MAG: hypothetical protein HC925_00825 [Coleofasciculaceae cyanobacterium SM2_3_26]|nr:hypothetical protein [Coleofasciculaceae cyanobacterium SM2_3_26]